MPAWSDYKREAKERGSLALELFVVRTVPVKSPEELRATLPDHLAYQAKQEAAGKLAFAGPVSDASGELMQGEGLIVYRAASIEEARHIADGDPMHVAGVREYDLRRWLVNEGSLTLEVGLSGQRVSLT